MTVISRIMFDVGKLWTAPEILRENSPLRRGTQRGDVYSFSIICYEIMMRTEPYNFDNITPRGTSTRRPTIRLMHCGAAETTKWRNHTFDQIQDGARMVNWNRYNPAANYSFFCWNSVSAKMPAARSMSFSSLNIIPMLSICLSAVVCRRLSLWRINVSIFVFT